MKGACADRHFFWLSWEWSWGRPALQWWSCRPGTGRKWPLWKGREASPSLLKSLVSFCSRAWPSWPMASGIAVLLPTLCKSSLPVQARWASLYLTSSAMLGLRPRSSARYAHWAGGGTECAQREKDCFRVAVTHFFKFSTFPSKMFWLLCH